MGGVVDFLVPNRFEFGYGLTPEIVALAAKRRPALIITVDNGIASVEGVDAAHALAPERGVEIHRRPCVELRLRVVARRDTVDGGSVDAPQRRRVTVGEAANLHGSRVGGHRCGA